LSEYGYFKTFQRSASLWGRETLHSVETVHLWQNTFMPVSLLILKLEF